MTIVLDPQSWNFVVQELERWAEVSGDDTGTTHCPRARDVNRRTYIAGTPPATATRRRPDRSCLPVAELRLKLNSIKSWSRSKPCSQRLESALATTPAR